MFTNSFYLATVLTILAFLIIEADPVRYRRGTNDEELALQPTCIKENGDKKFEYPQTHKPQKDFINKNPAQFALNAYKHARKLIPSSNLAYSPAFSSYSLALLLAGTKGVTLSELIDLIGPNRPKPTDPKKRKEETENFIQAMASIRHDVVSDVKEDIKLKSKIFTDERFQIRPRFQNIATQCFDTPVDQIDFLKNPKHSQETLNQYDGKEGSAPVVSNKTELVFLTFGDIQAKFSKELTENFITIQEEFTKTDGSKVKAEYLTIKHDQEFRLSRSEQASVLGIDTNDNALTIYFVHPTKNVPLSEFERSLDLTHLEKLLSESKLIKLSSVALPKFIIDGQFPMEKSFSEIGLKKLFSPDGNLNGVSNGLHLSNIKHDMTLRFDETGAHAQAKIATADDTSLKSNKIYEFFPNSPFAVVIKHKRTEQIILIGAVMEPKYPPPGPLCKVYYDKQYNFKYGSWMYDCKSETDCRKHYCLNNSSGFKCIGFTNYKNWTWHNNGKSWVSSGWVVEALYDKNAEKACETPSLYDDPGTNVYHCGCWWRNKNK